MPELAIASGYVGFAATASGCLYTEAQALAAPRFFHGGVEGTRRTARER